MATTAAASREPILVVSDSPADAALVKTLLEDDFTNIALSPDPDKAVGDFRQHRPRVLVLVFKDLQRSTEFYLGLDRSDGDTPGRPCRAVVLCTRDSVHAAYEQCRDGLFDDYVLFWPVTHDVPRLLMSVHGALDELAALEAETEKASAVAAHIERLAEKEGLLARELTRGEEHVAAAGRALSGAEREISTALAGLTEQIRHSGSHQGGLGGNHAAIGKLIELCKTGTLLPQLRQVSGSLQPLATWATAIQEGLLPVLEAAGDLGALVARTAPRILVVDDDEFQRKLTTRILESEGYQLSSAATGTEALNALAGAPHHLILMDFVMPGMNGIEVIERISAEPKFAGIPIIMITGNSERDLVLRSRALGVIDFVVKPLTRSALIAKVNRALRPAVKAQ